MSRRNRSAAAERRAFAPIFAALGDETRLALVAKLSEGQQFSIANACKDIDYAGALVAADPDGARIQAAILGALQRPVKAGLGDRFVSEMLDPEIERRAS